MRGQDSALYTLDKTPRLPLTLANMSPQNIKSPLPCTNPSLIYLVVRVSGAEEWVNEEEERSVGRP